MRQKCRTWPQPAYAHLTSIIIAALLALGWPAHAQFGNILEDVVKQSATEQAKEKAVEAAASDKSVREKDEAAGTTVIPAGTPQGSENYTGPKKRVAVMDMEVKITTSSVSQPTISGGVASTTTIQIPPPHDFGEGLTEMLTTALVETDRFIVLERTALNDIRAEQELGASGAVAEGSEASVGQLLGAQALIRGAVTEYNYSQSSTSANASILEGVLQGVSGGRTKAEAAVVLDVRLYDAATGQILDSQKAEGQTSATGTAISIDRDEFAVGSSQFKSTPLGHATRQAIEKAVEFIIANMEKVPWEARVAEVDTTANGEVETLYINAGSRSGLRAGDNLQVLRPGRTIVDPQTKVVIGRTKDKPVGEATIESVTPRLAIAVPQKGDGFEKNDVVRYIESDPTTGSAAN